MPPGVRIVAYHMANARPDVLAAQAAVFSKFRLPIEQVCSARTHGQFLTDTLRSPGDGVRAVVFADIDCVPLAAGVVETLAAEAIDQQSLVGCAQTSAYIEEEPLIRWQSAGRWPWRTFWRIHRTIKRKLNQPLVKPKEQFVYVGPCFMVVPVDLYAAVGRPSLEAEGFTFDVAARLTAVCRAQGRPVRTLKPIDCEVPRFWMDGRRSYGLGTTYENGIYHAFETTYRSNARSKDLFLKRCEAVLARP